MPNSSSNSSKSSRHRHHHHSSSKPTTHHHGTHTTYHQSHSSSPPQHTTVSTAYPSSTQHYSTAGQSTQQYTSGQSTQHYTSGTQATQHYTGTPPTQHYTTGTQEYRSSSFSRRQPPQNPMQSMSFQTPQTRAVWNETEQSPFSRAVSRSDTIISERVIEHEVKVPKRIIREDVIEKVMVIPEKVVREAVVEETIHVKEKIIEVAKPVIQEKIVEVPEYEYVEKIVEVPERVVKEKIREVPVTTFEERIVRVPKIYTQERVVEVPEIEYRDIPIEKIVEVPEIREQVVVKEIPVPQYVDKPTPEFVTVEVPDHYNSKIPVPVESVSTFAFKIPKMQPKYTSVDLTLYVPRFIEVPVPAEFMETASRRQAEQFAAQVNILAQQQGASLCEIENLAGAIKGADFSNVVSSSTNFGDALSNAWKEGKMQIIQDGAAGPRLTTKRNAMGTTMAGTRGSQSHSVTVQ